MVLAQTDVELRAREAEPLGGLRLVPPAIVQDLRYCVPLDRMQVGRHSSSPTRALQPQVLGADQAPVAQDRRTAQRVTPLADVARPIIPEPAPSSIPCQARPRTAEAL